METKPVITCLKTLLIVYSFVFWITGAILLAVGVWGKLMLGPYISLIADNSTNAPYVLIGTGTVIIVFGLFGCFATCRGSPWMLKLYAMFLSLVFLAELVAGISGFVFRHEIKGTFHRTYTDAVLNYNAENEASRAVDNLQHRVSSKSMTSTRLTTAECKIIFRIIYIFLIVNKTDTELLPMKAKPGVLSFSVPQASIVVQK
ncbi:hypothetical protein PAMA_003050 [Pampus argenteus]